MAKDKNQKNSGFNAPVIGKTYPKGTTFVKGSDGTIKPVPPKKKQKK